MTNKRNAFRFPNDPSAVFPQRADPVFLDVRTSALPANLLVKVRGTKPHKHKKAELIQNVTNEIAQEEQNKKTGEDVNLDGPEVIDMNQIYSDKDFGIIEEDDEMAVDDGGRRKKRRPVVNKDINIAEQTKKKTKKKKNKSQYIVNFK